MRRLEVRLEKFGKEEEKARMKVNEKHLNEFGQVMLNDNVLIYRIGCFGYMIRM